MVVITIAVLMTMVMTITVIVRWSVSTSVSLFNWLTTLRGFLSPYPSKIFMSHKGNGETDFLMSGQLFILTHAFTLLTHSIIHSLNHTLTQYSFINSITHSLSNWWWWWWWCGGGGVRQLKCVNLSVYNNLSICVCMEVCRMNVSCINQIIIRSGIIQWSWWWWDNDDDVDTDS